MKTLTEFSGTIIRMAAKADADVKATLPQTETPDEAAIAAIDAALTKETNLSGDRLARLKEALVAVGANTADVRLVRVYAGDATVANGKKVGEHLFLVENMPASMKPQFQRPEKERGGRGGGGGGGKREGGAPTSGFSMDSLKEDRSARRGPGGPGGGGGPRGPGGGGRGPGGPKA